MSQHARTKARKKKEATIVKFLENGAYETNLAILDSPVDPMGNRTVWGRLAGYCYGDYHKSNRIALYNFWQQHRSKILKKMGNLDVPGSTARRPLSSPNYNNLEQKQRTQSIGKGIGQYPASQYQTVANAGKKYHMKWTKPAASFNCKQTSVIDLHTPKSLLARQNLKTYLNKHNFHLLPPENQQHLLSLLPACDRMKSPSDQNLFCLQPEALNNEFFTKSCVEWNERLLEGAFLPENQSLLKNDEDRDKCKMDEWKIRHFEENWGDRQPRVKTEKPDEVPDVSKWTKKQAAVNGWHVDQTCVDYQKQEVEVKLECLSDDEYENSDIPEVALQTDKSSLRSRCSRRPRRRPLLRFLQPVHFEEVCSTSESDCVVAASSVPSVVPSSTAGNTESTSSSAWPVSHPTVDAVRLDHAYAACEENVVLTAEQIISEEIVYDDDDGNVYDGEETADTVARLTVTQSAAAFCDVDSYSYSRADRCYSSLLSAAAEISNSEPGECETYTSNCRGGVVSNGDRFEPATALQSNRLTNCNRSSTSSRGTTFDRRSVAETLVELANGPAMNQTALHSTASWNAKAVSTTSASVVCEACRRPNDSDVAAVCRCRSEPLYDRSVAVCRANVRKESLADGSSAADGLAADDVFSSLVECCQRNGDAVHSGDQCRPNGAAVFPRRVKVYCIRKHPYQPVAQTAAAVSHTDGDILSKSLQTLVGAYVSRACNEPICGVLSKPTTDSSQVVQPMVIVPDSSFLSSSSASKSNS